MNWKYVIQNGNIEENDNVLKFKGEETKVTDELTGKIDAAPLYSAIHFPIELKKGRIQFDVVFSDTCEDTRCGFILSFSNINGVSTCYHAGIRNKYGICSLDYFNGKAWDFLTFAGSPNSLEKGKQYSLKLQISGNVLTFFINDVIMFEYTKMLNLCGVCGIFTSNKADSTISNIDIQTEMPTSFSIMKFEKDFDELYKDVIAPVCHQFGYNSIRADECYTSSFIIDDIIREIKNSALIIADITMDNPNVFYELGYAHALGKPTILLADQSKREQLPFDISGYRTIFYENSIGGKKNIEGLLKKFIENIQRQQSKSIFDNMP